MDAPSRCLVHLRIEGAQKSKAASIKLTLAAVVLDANKCLRPISGRLANLRECGYTHFRARLPEVTPRRGLSRDNGYRKFVSLKSHEFLNPSA